MSKARLFGFILALFCVRGAAAQTLIKQAQTGNMSLLSTTTCASSSTARTFTLSGTPQGFGVGLIQIDFTAANTMSMTCDVSANRGLVSTQTWGTLQVCDTVTSGACTLINASWTKVVGSASALPIRVDFLGATDFRCTVTCSSGSFAVTGKMTAL